MPNVSAVKSTRVPGATSWAEEPFSKIEVLRMYGGSSTARVTLEKWPDEAEIKNSYDVSVGRTVITVDKNGETIRSLPTEVVWIDKKGVGYPIQIRSYTITEKGKQVGFLKPF